LFSLVLANDEILFSNNPSLELSPFVGSFLRVHCEWAVVSRGTIPRRYGKAREDNGSLTFKSLFEQAIADKLLVRLRMLPAASDSS